MKKKTLIIIGVAIAIFVALVASVFWFIQYNQKTISREQASSIAIKDAKFQESEVRIVKLEQKIDDGRLVYEIDFHKDTSEYSYVIDAKTGKIINREVDDINPKKSDPVPFDSKPSTPTQKPQLIGENKAKEIALKDANLQEADITRFTWKLDNESGVQVYELEFYHGSREYDYEINAATGQIIKKEIDASRR